MKLAFTSPSGAEKLLELMGPGQSFGETVMFVDQPYPVYAQVLMDTLLLHIAKSVFFALGQCAPVTTRVSSLQEGE